MRRELWLLSTRTRIIPTLLLSSLPEHSSAEQFKGTLRLDGETPYGEAQLYHDNTESWKGPVHKTNNRKLADGNCLAIGRVGPKGVAIAVSVHPYGEPSSPGKYGGAGRRLSATNVSEDMMPLTPRPIGKHLGFYTGSNVNNKVVLR